MLVGPSGVRKRYPGEVGPLCVTLKTGATKASVRNCLNGQGEVAFADANGCLASIGGTPAVHRVRSWTNNRLNDESILGGLGSDVVVVVGRVNHGVGELKGHARQENLWWARPPPERARQ